MSTLSQLYNTISPLFPIQLIFKIRKYYYTVFCLQIKTLALSLSLSNRKKKIKIKLNQQSEPLSVQPQKVASQ